MTKDEDTLPSEYKYVWKPTSDMSLDDFLKKYRPSMVQNDGTKPWIWVAGNKDHATPDGWTDAIEEASEILKETTEKVESIKNDASIPVRSNKKTGARSKKEVREEVQAEATKKLKEISQKHKYVTGKWLIFAPADKVDLIWSGIARSLVSGPLSATAAFTAKVSTSPEHDQPNYQHVMCIYVPDVYDKDAMAEIMRILLRNHGVSLSGVKSDLYTYIGIDSKHPSGIPSTIWKNNAVIPDAEAKELKDAFYKELAEKKPEAPASSADKSGTIADKAGVATDKPAPAPKKPLLKKKKAKDPFASDSEEENESAQEAKPAPETTKSAPDTAKPPSRSSAKPPSKSSAKPLSKSSVKPPSKSASKPPSRSSAKPPSARSSKPPSKTSAPSRTTRKRKAEPILEESEIESDDEPKPKKRAPARKPVKKRAKVDEDEEDED